MKSFVQHYARNRALLLLLILSYLLPCAAQSPYTLDWKKDLTITGAGGLLLGAGLYAKSKLTYFSPDRLEEINAFRLPALDRQVIHFNSPRARKASDVTLHTAELLPLAFMLDRKTRHDFPKIAVMWGEVLLINGGVTALTKYTIKRPRPFVYHDDPSISEVQSWSAQTSFISGHTSMTAASSFFAAKVFADYFPESKWKPAVWTAAAALPALTGYLRVRGGRHFPTDVIAGYAVGASIGLLVPALHKNRRGKERKLNLSPGMNRFSLTMQLN